jgi:cytidylate kinase
MENILLKYLTRSLESQDNTKEFGPVITISRDYGCGGTKLACLLADKINKKQSIESNFINWRVINKEILDKSATELHSRPHMISHLFNAEERGFYADIVASFAGKYYVSDERIKNTITKVIKSYAEEGNTIIVGRAAFIFTKHIRKSLHIKLLAPYDWRVNSIAERFDLSMKDAKVNVSEIDLQRNRFLKMYKSNINDADDFDMVFNLKSISKSDIVKVIVDLAEANKLF